MRHSVDRMSTLRIIKLPLQMHLAMLCIALQLALPIFQWHSLKVQCTDNLATPTWFTSFVNSQIKIIISYESFLKKSTILAPSNDRTALADAFSDPMPCIICFIICGGNYKICDEPSFKAVLRNPSRCNHS